MNTGVSTQNGRRLAALVSLALGCASGMPAAEKGISIAQAENRMVIAHGGSPIGAYVFQDPKIQRPYFANLHAPSGAQVTRRHPPVANQDATDHATMHPGLWLAFGDINGEDFWRNKASIRHERFIEPPSIHDGLLTFATDNRLHRANGQVLGTLRSRFSLTVHPDYYLLIWEATFAADPQEIVFGDQEEMGLGVRVATPIAEKNGGQIISSTGARSAKSTWGKAFDWCDYSGLIDGQRVGVTLMPDPANFRPSWFHNRDYGLMVANPFGRQAMKQGEVSRVIVKKGGKLRLRFGLLLHSCPREKKLDLAAAYRNFLAQDSRSTP